MTRQKKLKTLVARQLLDLSPLTQEFPDIVTWGVDCNHAIWVVLGCKSKTQGKHHELRCSPVYGGDGNSFIQICRIKDDQVRRVSITEPEIRLSFIQPTATGFLLADCRCFSDGDKVEANAVQYDWDGEEVKRLILGDGIEDLRTTPDGSIWAAYFDEGMFSGELPEIGCIGTPGLVCFNSDGEVHPDYDSREIGGFYIGVPYAANVVGDNSVWVYHYSKFPIEHFDERNRKSWEYGIGGANGLAVDEDRVLLYADYEKQHRLRIVQLGSDGKAVVRSEKLLVNESGAYVKTRRSIGVGKNLYILRKKKILVVDEW